MPERDLTEEAYYHYTLNALFTELRKSAYVMAARWSQLERARNPLLFSPGVVGRMSPKRISSLTNHFDKDEIRHAISEFSFTRLLVENDREMWFHFSKVDPDERARPDEEIYLRPLETEYKKEKAQMILVAAEHVTDRLVNQIVELFESSGKVGGFTATYGGEPLSKKHEAIKKTLETAIFSIFEEPDCEIRHIYFLPVVFLSGGKRVAGIFSIYTSERLNALTELLPILQPFAQGIMAPLHFTEIEEQRRIFSLRSAIAAIMSRNMSHNIGSHVLWHLSQELKSEELIAD